MASHFSSGSCFLYNLVRKVWTKQRTDRDTITTDDILHELAMHASEIPNGGFAMKGRNTSVVCPLCFAYWRRGMMASDCSCRFCSCDLLSVYGWGVYTCCRYSSCNAWVHICWRYTVWRCGLVISTSLLLLLRSCYLPVLLDADCSIKTLT